MMERDTLRIRNLYRILPAALTLILLMTLLGCSSVNRLREAQDTFNQTAALENAQQLDSDPAVATAALAGVRAGYTSVLLSLSKIENQDKEQLIRDKLWGSVLTLRALCQWRLGQYEKAVSNSEDAMKTFADQLFPRDHAVLAALPGLIKTDQGYEKTLKEEPLEDIRRLLIGQHGAVVDIRKARSLVDKDHPVQVYLIQTQLAAYRNYQVALKRMTGRSLSEEDIMKEIKELVQELKRVMNSQDRQAPSDRLILYWCKLFGVSYPQ